MTFWVNAEHRLAIFQKTSRWMPKILPRLVIHDYLTIGLIVEIN
jgi:hypothetical protein